MSANKWLMLNCDSYIVILQNIYLCAKQTHKKTKKKQNNELRVV